MDMRLSAYAVALGGLSFLGQAIAAPVEAKGDVAQQVEERTIEQRDGLTQEEMERLKYFHEPG